MAQIVTVANLKGGVGKSNIAVNVACELAGARTPVALVDADIQGTSAHWFGSGRLPVEGLALPLGAASEAAAWIKRVLALPASIVVIDCPPHLQAATEAAIGIADLVVLPVTASGADLLATQKALALVDRARQARSGSGPDALLVPSRVDRRTSAGKEIGDVLAGLKTPVGPEVRQLAAFVDAFSSGDWIGAYAPGSPAHADIQAVAKAVRRRLRR